MFTLLKPLVLASFNVIAVMLFYNANTVQANDLVTDTLLVGVHERPGYREKSASGIWHGIDVELLEAIFKQTPFHYEFIEMPWKRTLSALEAGKVDMTLSAALLPERQQYAWFSNEIFREGHNVLFAKKSKAELFNGVTSLSDLIERDIRLGVVRGVSYSDEFDQLAQQDVFTAMLIQLPDNAPLPVMLTHDRIDAYLDSEYSGLQRIFAMFADQSPIEPLFRVTSDTEAQTYLMFSKATVSPEVVSIFDEAMKKLTSKQLYKNILNGKDINETIPR